MLHDDDVVRSTAVLLVWCAVRHAHTLAPHHDCHAQDLTCMSCGAAPRTRSNRQYSVTSEVPECDCTLLGHAAIVRGSTPQHGQMRMHALMLMLPMDACAAKVIDAYPWLESSGVIDILLPKKEQICVGKWCA
jgi:hypothetical protein